MCVCVRVCVFVKRIRSFIHYNNELCISSDLNVNICRFLSSISPDYWGWSGGAMVLGELPVPGRPTIWMIVGQGPTVLAVRADGDCLDIFTLIYPFSSFSLSLGDGPI